MNLSRLAPRLILGVALLAGLLLLIAGPGVRAGFWVFPIGFQLMRYAAYAGLTAALLAGFGLFSPAWRRSQAPRLLLAFALGGIVAGVPWLQLRQARSLPPIHDITTDLADPPAFRAVLARRGDRSNPLDRAEPDLAAQQRAAYPYLAPLHLPQPPAEAFARALRAARSMGWEIVAADAERLLIEATATTFWFGFKDDVAIGLRPDGDGSRVDVRSVSRVGRSDLGANASRIRAYLERLAATP